jgi:uncharacterized membrane protein YfcA
MGGMLSRPFQHRKARSGQGRAAKAWHTGVDGMYDDVLTYLLLCLAAFAAGAVNSVAGGGTLLTFPSLLQTGMPSNVANMTSTVALVPGSMAGVWGYRREFQGTRPWVVLLIGPSLLGGLLGSLLLTELDNKYFELVVPWLLLLAASLFAVQPYLNRLMRPGTPHVPAGWPLQTLLVVFQFFIGVYGGYFGAGIGILMLASLGLMGVGDIHRMNAIKTLLASCINGVSVIVFVAKQGVDWRYGPVMAVASIAGGYFGARFGRLLPKTLIRWVVILVGLGLSGYYFAK